MDALGADERRHPQAQIILDETLKEQTLGLVGHPLTRCDCDARWGRGQWRPVPRHVAPGR